MDTVATFIKETGPYLPSWGLFVAFIVAVLRYGPAWKSQSFSEAENMCKTLSKELELVQSRLHKCEDDCVTQHRSSQEEIKSLHEELFGLRRQHVQEQISLINAIVSSIDSPELKALVRGLESVQSTLKVRRLDEPES